MSVKLSRWSDSQIKGAASMEQTARVKLETQFSSVHKDGCVCDAQRGTETGRLTWDAGLVRQGRCRPPRRTQPEYSACAASYTPLRVDGRTAAVDADAEIPVPTQSRRISLPTDRAPIEYWLIDRQLCVRVLSATTKSNHIASGPYYLHCSESVRWCIAVSMQFKCEYLQLNREILSHCALIDQLSDECIRLKWLVSLIFGFLMVAIFILCIAILT